MDKISEEALIDFIIFLGKERIIETQEMPSGALRYGRNLLTLSDIIEKYWEEFQ